MSVTWYCFFHHGDSTRSLSDADRRKSGSTPFASPPISRRRMSIRLRPPPIPVRAKMSLPRWLSSSNSPTSRTVRGHSGKTLAWDGSPMSDSCQAWPGRRCRNRECFVATMPSPIPPVTPRPAYIPILSTTRARRRTSKPGSTITWSSTRPLVANLPGVRAVTVDTPAVIVSGLPFRFSGALLRNKAVFDSAEALSVALSSPARDALRADVAAFPEFLGGSVHVPMETLGVPGAISPDTGPGLDPFHLAPSNS